MSNLSRWSSLIDASLLDPVKSHEGLSGPGAHWGEAPGFQGGVAAMQESRNVPFLAAPGPPATPQTRDMPHFRKRERRLTIRPPPLGREFFRANKLR